MVWGIAPEPAFAEDIPDFAERWQELPPDVLKIDADSLRRWGQATDRFRSVEAPQTPDASAKFPQTPAPPGDTPFASPPPAVAIDPRPASPPMPTEMAAPAQPDPLPPTDQPIDMPQTKDAETPMKICQNPDFRMVIDVGHTEKNYGAMSARNKPEFAFNKRLATELLAKLQSAGFTKTEMLVQQDNDLNRRSSELSSRKPNLMLSLHHDSVQDRFLQTGMLEGVQRTYTTYARGYSIFISRDNSHLEESKRFAIMLGQQLMKFGLKPTMHHSEHYAGENRPIADAENGVFYYDHLVVLRQTTAPAALLESAVITEPDDELRAEDPVYRGRITNAILAAVDQYCIATKPNAAPAKSNARK